MQCLHRVIQWHCNHDRGAETAIAVSCKCCCLVQSLPVWRLNTYFTAVVNEHSISSCGKCRGLQGRGGKTHLSYKALKVQQLFPGIACNCCGSWPMQHCFLSLLCYRLQLLRQLANAARSIAITADSHDHSTCACGRGEQAAREGSNLCVLRESVCAN